jgi:hypothetical protein
MEVTNESAIFTSEFQQFHTTNFIIQHRLFGSSFQSFIYIENASSR